MLRKTIILAMVILILIAVPASFANVSPDDIIVAEPVRTRLFNDRTQFITVNITNPDVIQNPIGISLVRIENRIPFVESINEGLSVSVMYLNRNAANIEGVAPARRLYDLKSKEYSQGFSNELRTINRFFEAKDELSKLDLEISKVMSNQNFHQFFSPQEAKSKLDEDTFARYEKWVELRGKRRLVANELANLQTEYLKLFETDIFTDEIRRLSYFNEVGTLSNGQYRLRFIDANQRLIKEVRFEVVNRESIVVPVMPFN